MKHHFGLFSPAHLSPLWSSIWSRTAGCRYHLLSPSGPGSDLPEPEPEPLPTPRRRRRRASSDWDQIQTPGTDRHIRRFALITSKQTKTIIRLTGPIRGAGPTFITWWIFTLASGGCWTLTFTICELWATQVCWKQKEISKPTRSSDPNPVQFGSEIRCCRAKGQRNL